MSVISKTATIRSRYHRNAYDFVFDALKLAQKQLERPLCSDADDQAAHISGEELLEGVRELAHQKFGLMTLPVFHCWGVRATEDFGRIVFELIERGEMRKTDRDNLIDFVDVYDFEEVFDRDFQIDITDVFHR